MPDFEMLNLADMKTMAADWSHGSTGKKSAFIAWLNSVPAPNGDDEEIIIQHPK